MSDQELKRLRKIVPRREIAEDVRRIGLFLPEDSEDQLVLFRVAEFLLDARQILHGGKRNVRGSRHWDDI